MNNLGSLLSKFRNLLQSHKANQTLFCEALLETVGVDINPSSVHIKGVRIIVKAPPVVKNEIVVRKEVILKSFYSKGGNSAIQDIS